MAKANMPSLLGFPLFMSSRNIVPLKVEVTIAMLKRTATAKVIMKRTTTKYFRILRYYRTTEIHQMKNDNNNNNNNSSNDGMSSFAPTIAIVAVVTAIAPFLS
mmetsp:Transcript_38396/g.43058  ORF Transcript_38396/g.43058 Transcript_38396/m.43058 type:complete len:103 (+) Transcript_38396:593-901(+)